ncbi:MAG: Threonine--tRNA ligase [Methanonatronarchaeales archaeon]|nr:Threonine--tRNA ligase [Methanonatronarchaeales archaeon]
MKLLLLHADELEYEATTETPVAEELDGVERTGGIEEALVAFVAVESGDEEDPENVAEGGVREIESVAGDLGVDIVALYPYAHLSSDLSSPEVAIDVLDEMETSLSSRYGVTRAPFGWYKAFRISVKGHPLAELSREVTPVGSEESEEAVTSEFYVLEGGESLSAEEYGAEGEFRFLVDHELGVSGDTGEEPPHVALMKEKRIADYEPLSDAGHLRWYPRGRFIRDLLSSYVDELVVGYGGMPVETPLMYDLGNRAVREHAAKFGEKQYRFESGNREMMLRFAQCFGMFSIWRDSHLDASHFPVKTYERGQSFRREQRGEIVGLKRSRSFWMPDLHTATRDAEEARRCFEEQLDLCLSTREALETDYEAVFRCTRDFYDENEGWVKKTASKVGKPVLLEVLSDRKHYWTVKADLAVIDALGRPIENPTVQIDVESSERFDIEAYDEGEPFRPVILHCSPTGSLLRMMCSLLENAAKAEELGEKPSYPVWLSPTQVRVLPVADRNLEYAERIVEEVEAPGFRCDLDDRSGSLGRKIRTAESDWVPYICIVGDDEEREGNLSLRIRATGEERAVKLQELLDIIEEETAGHRRLPLPLPRRLSRRPGFA